MKSFLIVRLEQPERVSITADETDENNSQSGHWGLIFFSLFFFERAAQSLMSSTLFQSEVTQQFTVYGRGKAKALGIWSWASEQLPRNTPQLCTTLSDLKMAVFP